MSDDTLPSRWALWVALCIALLARLTNWQEQVWAGRVLFYGPDSEYHARRILYTLSHYPRMIVSDSGLSTALPPMQCPWPPLYDGFLATILLPFNFLGLPQASLEFFLAFIPPLAGGFSVYLIYQLARSWFGLRTAVGAAFLLALLPAHIHATRFANIDHHWAEVAFWIVLALLTGRMLDRPASAARGLVVGLFAGAGLGIAQVVSVGVFCFAAFLIFLEWRGRLNVWVPFGLFASSWAMVAISLGTGLPLWSFQTISGLHASIASIPLFYFGILHFVSRKIRRETAVWVAGFVTLLGAVFWLQLEAVKSLIFEGAGFVGRNPVIALISESRPLIASKALSIGFYGYLAYCYPLLLALAIFRLVRDKSTDSRRLFFLFFACMYLPLSFLQLRFAFSSVPFLVLVLAEEFGAIFQRWGKWKENSFVGAVAVLSFANAWPFLPEIAPSLSRSPSVLEKDQSEVATWLRSSTPVEGSALSPSSVPAYRVLAPWYLGHLILHRADRAVVTNPFIFDAKSPGLIDSLRFFYEWDEAELLSFCQSHNIRYVILDQTLHVDLRRNLNILGIPYSDYVSERNGRIQLAPKYRDSFVMRYGGAPGRGNFKLVYESSPRRQSQFNGKIGNRFKVFERIIAN